MSHRVKSLLEAPTDAVMAEAENVLQMGHHKSSDLLIFACPINTFPVKRWSGGIIHEMKLAAAHRNRCLSIIKSTVKWQYWKHWNMYFYHRHDNLTVAVWTNVTAGFRFFFLFFIFPHKQLHKRQNRSTSLDGYYKEATSFDPRGAQLSYSVCRCYQNIKASKWWCRWVSVKSLNHQLYTKLISTAPTGT